MRIPRIRIVLRFRTGLARRRRFLLISMAAHAACAGAILVAPSLRSAPRPADTAFVVELAPGVAMRPAGRPAAVHPAPSPAPTAPAPKPEPKTEPKPRAPKGPSVVREVPKPSKTPAEPKPQPKPAEDQPDGPETDGGATPGPAGPEGPGIVSLETGDPGLAWYNASVTGALKAAWTPPPLETTPEPLSVIVAFEIDRTGAVLGTRIDVSSGVPSLDRSAIRAVSDAAPFPRPPAGLDPIRQRVRFDYRPESP